LATSAAIAAATVPVRHYRGRLHGAGQHEHLTQTLARGGERQAPKWKICAPSQPPADSP